MGTACVPSRCAHGQPTLRGSLTAGLQSRSVTPCMFPSESGVGGREREGAGLSKHRNSSACLSRHLHHKPIAIFNVVTDTVALVCSSTKSAQTGVAQFSSVGPKPHPRAPGTVPVTTCLSLLCSWVPRPRFPRQSLL